MDARSRRVIDGVRFEGRPTTYKVIRYFGAIGTAHNVPLYKKFWEILPFTSKGYYGELVCAGSLITPVVFQTACHCLASFANGNEDLLKPAAIDHRWEGRYVVYVGVSYRYGDLKPSMESESPVWSERFLAHSQCGKLGPNGPVTHDFGIIVLEAGWIKSNRQYPWTEIDCAPQYTSKEIDKFTKDAIKVQSVCMSIGFGLYHWYKIERSNYLRHGWEVIYTRSYCIKQTAFTKSRGPLSVFEINEYMTWVCLGNFSKHEQEPGPADSGSPITCSNELFGVHSGRTYFRNEKGTPYDIVPRASAIIHNPLVNSINYRLDLINSIHNLQEAFPDPNVPRQRDKFDYQQFQAVASVAQNVAFLSHHVILLTLSFLRMT